MDIANKRYYGIGELAKAFNVNTSLIRYWETQFDFFTPQKNPKGNRRYTQKDVESLRLIYHVVKELGFTLDGARDYLKQYDVKAKENMTIIQKLERIKNELAEIYEDIEKTIHDNKL